MEKHMEDTLRAFSPRNPFHLWISDEIALMMIRVDRIGRMDRRQRDQSALRAEFFSDDDRRLLAEELGERLAKHPTRVVRQLKSTPQGCDWLVERWGWLQAVLDAGKTWNDFQSQAAIDLLGIARQYREAATDRLSDPARLVRDELASLEAQKAKVAESDVLERSLAMTDAVDPNTRKYRSLKRLEGQTHRRMKWAIELLDLIPKFIDAHPAILEARNLLPMDPISRAAALQPVAPPPAEPELEPLPRPWVQSAPTVPPPLLPPLPHPAPAPAPARRPDPVKLRAKTRSQAARQRREDRPDR